MNGEISLLIIVAIISIFILLFLSCFLIYVKTEQKLSNHLFSVFLVFTTIDISSVLFTFFLDGNLTNIGMCRNLITFLQLPTFYLYVLSVCYLDFKLKTKHLIHIIPFLMANLILFPRFYLADLSSKITFLENSKNLFEIPFIHIFLHIQIAFYIILVFITLRKAKKIYLENYATANIDSFNWLFELTLALSVFYFAAFIKNIFKFTSYPDVSEGLKTGLFVFELFIVSWYLFKALNNPTLFRNIDSKLKLVKDIIKDIVKEEKKEEKTDITTDFDVETNLILIKLTDFMLQKKPFLNPSLTIRDISDEIEIPTRELSILINHKLGQHFFDFINHYRIEHAMTILNDTTKNKVTILEILYEVGFNSKSSFNVAFKKHTGITPTEYRKNLKINTL